MELAEYAVAKGIEHQPVFCWWVSHVLRKHDQGKVPQMNTQVWI